MLLHHEVTVPATVDEVWLAMGDIEGIAPCLPGAAVERVDGDTVYGSMTVKVGPITVAYQGRAVLDERDDATHRMVLHATGRERRGAGTARADLTATVADRGGAAAVSVDTDLTITGRPAQFGRGVMADIGDRVIAEFAARLSDRLAVRVAEASAPISGVDDVAPSPGEAAVESTIESEPLDLLDMAAPFLRHMAARVLLVLALLAVGVALRHRRTKGAACS